MSKNIVVMSDGTGQDGGEKNNTNVYKLFNMLEDRTERQITFYDRGLGTGRHKLAGLATGYGISRNIRECYEFIFDHFEAGDQIYLFGFSRGASTVRSLSALIHYFGILPKSRPELIKKAYKIYKMPANNKKEEKEREARAKAFVDRHHTMWTKIRFLGVWDTVLALGVPFPAASTILDKVPFFRHKFHNMDISESVEHARQALAIDDERKTFHPKIWNARADTTNRSMKQVWFCGMHTDVGGGYEKQELSDIALQWMVDEAREHGLLIYHGKDPKKLSPDPNGFMHDSREKGLSRWYRKKQRTWNVEQLGQPVVHKSVTMRTRSKDNEDSPKYGPWIMDLNPEVEPWTKWPDGLPPVNDGDRMAPERRSGS